MFQLSQSEFDNLKRQIGDLNLKSQIAISSSYWGGRRARLRLALSAVVEEERGMLSYWALKHPPGKPDFHHPDAFALELEPRDGEAVNESAMGKR